MFTIFWPFHLFKAVIGLVVGLMVLSACALTGAAFFAEKGWFFDTASHFLPHYLVIQLLALGLFLIGVKLREKSRVEVLGTLIFLGFFIGLNLVQIAPYYLPRLMGGSPDHRPTVTVMHMNVLGQFNHRPEQAARLIRDTQPDIVSFVEYLPDWQRKMEATGALKNYPYRVAGRANIGLYSRIPLTGTKLIHVPGQPAVANTASLLVRFKLDNQPVSLLVTHPISPFLPGRLAMQQHSFRQWARERQQYGKHLILMGDLNTTPWSAEFKSLVRATDLRDSQLGFGLQPSWPAFLVPLMPPADKAPAMDQTLARVGIPIDHILVSRDIEVLNRRVGPFIGSDHLPVIATLRLRQGS